jgi:hypothetical protein
MKTGVELIAQERQEQIEKHNRSIEVDVILNTKGQLSEAAAMLAYNESNCLELDEIALDHCPEGWDQQIWSKMVYKPYKERLIIAGALIAAEIDRLNNSENP